MISIPNRRLPAWAGPAVAAVLAALVVVQHASWLGLHTAVETWDDDAGLFRLALCFASGNEAACSVGAPYPPLVPWVSSRLMGEVPTLQGALASLWPFVALLMGALFVGVRQRMGTMKKTRCPRSDTRSTSDSWQVETAACRRSAVWCCSAVSGPWSIS